MNTARMHTAVRLLAALALLAALTPVLVVSHCDTMNGPVVTAAREALKTGNVDLVLIWVQKDDEAVIREAFQKTLAIRTLSAEAQALADMYFFETLVRIHRAGEGVAYTGLKPEETEVEPGIAAADNSLVSGSADELLNGLEETIRHTVSALHREVLERKSAAAGGIEAGRRYVSSYVEFIHYVERLHLAASQPAAGHAGHGAEPPHGE